MNIDEHRQTLEHTIRTVPDWPKPGIQFRDITPVLQDRKAFRLLIDLFVHRYRDANLDYVAGVDARGFILGAPLAHQLGLGFIPVRKKGKLPFDTIEESYDLEYGSATVEIHADACQAGQRILLIDDLVATGGTLLAAAKLFRRIGATVVETAALVDLPELGGSARIRNEGLAFYTVCDFPGH
jgi:adenine phosphoribosyltransferase